MKRFVLFIALAAAGCNQCGDRPRLLSRVRDRIDGDHPAPAACADGAMVGRGTGYGNLPPGFPVGNGTPIYGAPTYGVPTYPAGESYPAGPTRADELPAPGYISPPGVPYAPPRTVEQGRTVPPRPNGLTTGKQ